MKKKLALAVVLAVLSTSVFATKARLLSLGETEDQTGSLYYSDNRNMFLNPAYVNEYKDMVTFEWGNQGNAATRKDTDVSPKAEGGVTKTFGNFVGGIHLGEESYSTHDARQYLRLVDATGPKIHQDNQIDAFIGGDAGIKWGANLTYSNTNDKSEDMEQKSLSTRFGLIGDKFEALLNISLFNKAEIDANTVPGKDEFEGKLGFEVGGNYNLGAETKVFAFWRHAKFETNAATAATIAGATQVGPAYQGEAEFKINKYRFGAGRIEAHGDKAKLYTKIEYVRNTRDVSTNDGDADLKDYSVPVTFGIEYDATSWLTLRGSVYQSLIGKQDNDYDSTLRSEVNPAVLDDLVPGKRTLNSTTNVNTGATLKFGELSVDGLIGTGTASGTTTDSKSEQGNLTLDNLMTRVAMTYRF